MLVVIGALAGVLFGGWTGLFLGGAAGYFLTPVLRKAIFNRVQDAQTRFIDPMFEIMGALCKADGVVTRDEIQTVERIFDTLRLSGTLRDRAKAAFNRGKQAGFDVEDAADRFKAAGGARPPFQQIFLQFQAMAIAADGVIHPDERAMLLRVIQRLGLTEKDLEQFEALLRSGGQQSGYTGGQPRAASSHDLNAAYLALGVSPSAEDAEVKRAYRRLISENHPDKLAARGLPESMRAVAEERSREINKAYDRIKEARGMT